MAKFVYRKIKKIGQKARPNSQGFTLIEVLVATVLFLILVNTAYELLYTGLNAYRRSSTKSDDLTQLRIGLNRMERELREARWLTTNTGNSYLKFRLPNHITDTNQTVPLTYSRDKIITYYVNEGQLLRKIYDLPSSGFDGQTPNRGEPAIHRNEGVNEIANNIVSLQLTYLPVEQSDNSYKNTVIITLTAQSTDKPMTLTSTVRLRAQEGW